MEGSERSFCKKSSVAESLSSKSDLWRTDRSFASMIREYRNYGDHWMRERVRESLRLGCLEREEMGEWWNHERGFVKAGGGGIFYIIIIFGKAIICFLLGLGISFFARKSDSFIGYFFFFFPTFEK